MKHKLFGTCLILLGLCLMLGAGGLAAYNLWEEDQADQAAQEAMEAISLVLEPEAALPTPVASLPEETIFTEPTIPEDVPYYVLNPEIEMLEQEIKGIAYIGVLEIPDLELELPIASKWSGTTARKAPCRYTGTAYLNNMVIAGHNYKKHFGKLSSLPIGTRVLFTDMEGNAFTYEILEFETVQPTAIEHMITGDWDLTLFTCTVGGRARVAVRCGKVVEEA